MVKQKIIFGRYNATTFNRMKQKSTISLIFAGLVTLICGIGAYGQDGASSGDGYSSSSNQNRTQYGPGGEDSPPGGKSKNPTVTPKDSISSKPVFRSNYSSEPVKTSKDESEDESVNTFNFLYYIIRKYKLQDIVD